MSPDQAKATLLSRLQAAAGPSRELDAEIALANGWKKSDPQGYWCAPDGDVWATPPRYTESIDAALTLLPEDFPREFRSLNIEGEMQHEARINFDEWYVGENPALALL